MQSKFSLILPLQHPLGDGGTNGSSKIPTSRIYTLVCVLEVGKERVDWCLSERKTPTVF